MEGQKAPTRTVRLGPFTYTFEGSAPGRIAISGGVAGGEFVLRAFGQTVPLTTVEVGTDGAGAFAVVLEQEHEFAGRIRLLVCREYEEDQLPGGQVSVDLPLDPAAFERALADAGVRVRADRVKVLTPIERGFSVFFDGDGRVNGSAWVGAQPGR